MENIFCSDMEILSNGKIWQVSEDHVIIGDLHNYYAKHNQHTNSKPWGLHQEIKNHKIARIQHTAIAMLKFAPEVSDSSDAPIPIPVQYWSYFWQYRIVSVRLQMPDTNRYFL